MSVQDAQARRSEAPGIAVRTAAAILGAYAACYFLTSALAALLFRAGVGRVDCAIASTSIALLAFPAISVWAFAERSLWRVGLWPPIAAALLAVVTWAAQP